MYVVRNLTKRTIILSDLKAEIGPYKMLDLEKVAHREDVSRSRDLRNALKSARLRLMSNSVAKQPKVPEVRIIERIIEKQVEKHHTETIIDEGKLEAIMRKILSEQPKPPTQIQESVPVNKILDAFAALQQKIDTFGTDKKDSLLDMPNIDPERLADLQSKAIEQISKNIETGVRKTGKKVKLKDTNLSDLASELD